MTVHGGSYHAKIGYSSSGGDNYLITPQLSPVAGETLKFYIGSTTWGGSTLTVEVSETTNTSASDFTTVLATYLSNVDMNKTWGDAKEISLSAYAGKNIYIAFHMVDNNGDNVYIDDVSIEAPVTCPKTGTPEASSVGQNTATISWAEGGSETKWNLRYKSASASDWTTVNGLEAKSHNLTGLTAGKTTYNYEVQADCGGGDASDWNAGTPFQTECGAISVATEDWKDGFEGYTAGFSTTAPGCYAIIGANASSSSYPRIHVTSKSSNSGYVQTGNNSLFIVSSGSDDSYIIFPEFTEPLNTLQIAFSHKGEAGGYPSTVKSSKLTLGYVTDVNDATTFHALRDEFTRSTSWTAEEESLAGIPADVENARLAFKVGASETNNYFTGIDDITISALPSCTKPTVNNATDETFEGATFTWAAGGSETQWQYIVVGFGAAEDWSSPTLTSTNSVTLTGYNAATTYDFYVRSYCSSSEQSESVKKSFTTLAVTAPTAPQVTNAGTTTADFSWNAAAGVSGYQYVAALSGQEPDWNNAQNTTAASVQLTNLLAGNTYVAYVRSFYSNNNCYSAVVASDAFDTQCETKTIDADHSFTETFDAFHCWTMVDQAASTGWYENNKFRFFYSKNPPQYLISPEFVTEDRQITVEFDYWKYISGTESFKLGYSTTTKEVSAFTFLEEVTVTNTSALTYSKNLPAGVKYVAIKYTANDQYYLYIDNFTVTEYVAPSCFAPTGLSAATSITPEGATFTWSASGHGEDTYQWAVAVGSADPEWVDDAAHKVSTTTKTLTGLTAGTNYKFYVRSYCGASDQSSAIASASFSPVLNAPTDLAASAITASGATISWTAATGVSNYEYSLREGDQSLPAWTSAVAVNGATSVNLTELNPSTTYSLWVRSVYNTSKSGNSLKLSFTTKCEAIAVNATYTENFNSLDNGAIPGCWDNSEGTTTTASYKWKATTGGQSGKCLVFNGVDNGYNKTNILATPTFTLSSDADLVFYWKNAKTGEYKVQVSVDGAAREDFITGLVSKSAWTKAEEALTDYDGHSVQFFFCGTSISDGDANLYLDEFQIVPVSCRKPASDPVVSSKDATTATLTWTAGGTNADYQFALAFAGEEPVWDAENVVSELTKSFNDLTPITNYDFYVRTYCGSENQSEARKVSFKTDCADYVTLPFIENFNSLAYQAIPECWNNDEGTSGDYYKWKAVMPVSSTNYVQFNSSTNDADATNVLATPVILLGESNLLTFRCMNPTGGDFKVQIQAEGEERADLLTGLTGIADWTLKYAAIPASYNNKKVQLFFCATSNEGDQDAYISLDDVRVKKGIVLDETADNTFAPANEEIDVVMARNLLFNGDYNTLCLPFSLSAEQLAAEDCPLNNFKLKVFDYSTVVGDELQIAIAGASSIEAGQPYFAAYQGAAVDNKALHLFKDVVISTNEAGKKENGQVTYQGVLNHDVLPNQSANSANPEILYLGAGNKIYWPSTNVPIKGFRAYFKVDYSSAPNGAPVRPHMSARIVEHAEMPTGLEGLQGNEQVVKMLENNQVIIIRNGVKYSIQGQKIL